MTTGPEYQQKLEAEAALWGSEAERQAQAVPPDWHHHRHLRHNVIMHAADIDALLERIEPGMTALELGCASGWLTLAMAERGADATGLDISERSLSIARAYYDQVRDRVTGSAQYLQMDLNALSLQSATYDVIAVKASLHHLIQLERVIDEVHRALKPGGLFWVADTVGDEALTTVLVAGALTLVLPTEVPYREKLRALIRFGPRAPSRVRASIQAEGLSPFEGAGREQDWVELISRHFTIEKRVNMPAFTGYVTAQLKAPDEVALPLLRLLRFVDRGLVRLGLMRNSGVILYARR